MTDEIRTPQEALEAAAQVAFAAMIRGNSANVAEEIRALAARIPERNDEALAWNTAHRNTINAAQAAEIERLREMTRNQAQEYLALDMQATEALARATTAEAEAKRLREALKDYACDCPKQCWDCKVAKGVDWVDKGWTARAALTERKP